MSAYRRLFRYVWRYRRPFALGLICSFINTGVTLAAPLVLQSAVDGLRLGATVGKLAGYGAALLAIGLVSGVFRFWTRRILVGTSRDLEYDMRNDFFAHLQTLPLGYYQAHRTGDLMSRATNDLGTVRMMIGPSVMYSANTLLTFVAALSMMAAIDVRLTLFALIPLPFASISVKVFGAAIHRRFEQIQAQLSEISAVAQEALSGVRVVRAYRQEATELSRFRRANDEYVRRSRNLIVIQGLFFPCMSLFLGLGAVVTLWLGSRAVISGRITLGQFVAFTAYLTMLSWPMIAFGWVTNIVQRGLASWKRMLEVLDAAPAIHDSDEARARAAIRGDIEFRHLTFGYDGTPVLRDVSLHVPAGTTAAIVGLTGSGKSTLMSLIARLHEPPPGTVLIDGRDVRDIPLATLRSAIGFVPQEPFLFSDTIADNVAFGLDGRLDYRGQEGQEGLEGPEGAEGRERLEGLKGQEGLVGDRRMQRIEHAAAVARLDKDVADFPQGYATVVGERGITLSGGQKQRAAIARAVAIDPRILILDDSLSAVDTYTEEEILARLSGVMRQRTSLIVSHRISTVREADQILVLDQGRIAERGTHAELLTLGGIYAELHQKQLLEEELAAS